jgi:hypothetical protein
MKSTNKEIEIMAEKEASFLDKVLRELPDFTPEIVKYFREVPYQSVMKEADPAVTAQRMTNTAIENAPLALPVGRLLGMMLKSPTAMAVGATALTGDPTNLIPGKAGLAMLEGSKDAEAAFRPRESSIPSEFVKSFINAVQASTNRLTTLEDLRDLPRETIQAGLNDILLNQLTPKAVSKYGTEEFVLDRFLPSTIHNQPTYTATTISDIVNSYEGKIIGEANNSLVESLNRLNKAKERQADLPSYEARTIKEAVNTQVAREEDAIQKIQGVISKQGYLIQDLTKIVTDPKNTPVFGTGSRVPGDKLIRISPQSMMSDITEATSKLSQKIVELGVDPAGKNLQQLVATVNVKIAEAEKAAAKNQKLLDDTIVGRTRTLMQNAKDESDVITVGGKPFVKLEDAQSLSDETAYLNHCVGAIDRTNDKYIPYLDPITGKATQNRHKGYGGFNQYMDRIGKGELEIYSFRPEGKPEFTVAIDPRTGVVTQAYGKGNSSINADQDKVLGEFIKSYEKVKGISVTRPPNGWGEV